MKVAITAKKVVILLMTMALAVAFVACQGAAGLPGEPGEPGKPGEPGAPAEVLQPPYVVLELSDLPAIVAGMTDTLPLSGAFGDPDGTAEALTLTAKSNDTTIATAEVSGTTLTVVAVKAGTTAVVVTATDADGLSVSQSVQVNVIAAPPEPDPPVTIDDVKTNYPTLAITPTTAADASMEIELPADHTLISENSAVVTVAKKAAAAKSTPTASIQWASATADDTMAMNVWVVTAESRGVTNVDVLDKTGVSVHTIRVTVTDDPPPPPVPPVAPTVKAGGIGPQTLYLADGPMDLVLTTSKGSDKGYFTHESAITYAVSADPTGYVEVSEANGTLTLKPLLDGRTRVTVVATADTKSTAPVTFTVTVMPDSKPPPTAAVAPSVKTGGIEDQTLYLDAAAGKAIVLTTSEGSDKGYFTHTSAITYAVSADPTGYVEVSEANGTLTLKPLLEGTTRVTIVATADSKSAAPVTFRVTVKASTPTTPPPDMPDEPMATEETVEAEVEVGDTETVDASMYFTPADGLEFSGGPHEDDDHIVDATVDETSGVVTIEGLEEGEATITVTATNAAGTAILEIDVTVTPEGIPHIDELNGMVTIEGVGTDDDMNIALIRIDVGQRLQHLDADYVTASLNTEESSDTSNVWTLTGIKKTADDTPARVRIWNKDQTRDGDDIEVTVENTRPEKKDDPTTLVVVDMANGDPVPVNKENKSPGDDERSFHRVVVDWKKYFDDEDGFPGDIKEYEAHSNIPEVEVIDAFKDGIVVDVTETIEVGFPLVVYVVDMANEMSDTVTLQVRESGLEPIAEEYEVHQLADSLGGFSSQDVWLRKDAEHTLTFATDGDETVAHSGFRFVKLFQDKLDAEAAATPVAPPAAGEEGVEGVERSSVITSGTPPTTVGLEDPETDAVSNSDPYYTVSSDGPIELLDGGGNNEGLTFVNVATGLTGTPTLMFKVTRSGRATVTITYNEAVGRDDDRDGTLQPDEWGWESAKKVLTLNIVPSS